MSRFLVVLFTLALASLVFAASATKLKHNVKPIDGREQTTFTHIPSQSAHGPHCGVLDDSVGSVYVAGNTWYDFQHNGTAGKMIGVDDLGFVHIAWMRADDGSFADRHAYYNVWDPATEQFTILEGQADGATRGGYVTLAVKPNGYGFPGYHQEIGTSNPVAHTSVSFDMMARWGAMTGSEPAYLFENNHEMEIIWPKVDMDINGRLHVASTENPASGVAGDPQRIYYSRGVPEYEGDFCTNINWDTFGGGVQLREMDTVMVISPDIACSRYTNRVVMAWNKSRDTLNADPSQFNNDIVYSISEDGGDNWAAEVNVTNFIYPDWDCASGDTLICDADTFRAYTDLSLILDEDDDIHIAFTTVHYYTLEGTVSRYSSQIWHWSSDSGYVSPIFAVDATYGDTNWAADLGDWQYVLQRPNLAVDPITDHLYCCFVLADSDNWSNLGIPMQDIWVSKSWDDGVAWTQAINVTNTNTGEFVPAGESAHERDATLAKTVTEYNGEHFLHLSYVYDLDAGGAVGNSPIGVPTDNPVCYQRINVDDIPNMPLWLNNWPVLHIDSTDMPPLVTSAVDDGGPGIPESFALHQNFPNPFNPSTNIQFDLAQSAKVTLKVFNVLGEEVATLLNNAPLEAGVRTVKFEGTGLASGVYLYRLDAAGMTQTRKMVLMK